MSNYFLKARLHLNTLQKTGAGDAALHFGAYFPVGCCIYLTSEYWLKCNIIFPAAAWEIRLWCRSLIIKQKGLLFNFLFLIFFFWRAILQQSYKNKFTVISSRGSHFHTSISLSRPECLAAIRRVVSQSSVMSVEWISWMISNQFLRNKSEGPASQIWLFLCLL